MKKGNLFLIIMFMFILSLNLVISAPPFQTTVTSNKGIQLEVPVIMSIEQNEDFKFHTHPYNISDGLLIPQSDIYYCMIHIYNTSNGEHIIEDNMTADSNGIDWGYIVLGGNFSEIGEYSILFYCEVEEVIGGFFEFAIDVTKTGKEINTSESLIYFILFFGVFLLFALSFYFMISVPYSNKIDEKGVVIQLTKLKYVKLGLILLTWVLFTWVLNILIGLSDNFVSLTMYYGFFGFMFSIMNRLALWVGITVIVIAFFEIIRDSNIQENISKFGSSP